MKKNIKFNKTFIHSILYGGLTLALIACTCGCKKTDSKKNDTSTMNSGIVSNSEATDEDLDQYIAKRYELQQEIEALLEQKEKLQNEKTFNLVDLIVIESAIDNKESNLYILNTTNIYRIYEEYHGEFLAWERLHPHTTEHPYDYCCDYIHFNWAQPLFYYLTEEEQEKLSSTNGKITTLQLDEILVRMRNAYQEKMQKIKQK